MKHAPVHQAYCGHSRLRVARGPAPLSPLHKDDPFHRQQGSYRVPLVTLKKYVCVTSTFLKPSGLFMSLARLCLLEVLITVPRKLQAQVPGCVACLPRWLRLQPFPYLSAGTTHHAQLSQNPTGRRLPLWTALILPPSATLP